MTYDCIVDDLYLGPEGSLKWCLIDHPNVTRVIRVVEDLCVEPGRVIGAKEYCISDAVVVPMLYTLRFPLPDGERVIDVLHIPLSDEEEAPVCDFFPCATQFVREAQQQRTGVYIHCMASVSRSATIVVAIMMVLRKLPAEEALAFVKARRPIIRPNDGFAKQLKWFEEDLRGVGT